MSMEENKSIFKTPRIEKRLWFAVLLLALFAILPQSSLAQVTTATLTTTDTFLTTPSIALLMPPWEGTHMNTLNNGVRIILAKNADNRILAVSGFMSFGARMDTVAEPGTTYLTQQLLLKGTRKRSAAEIAEDIEEVGGSIAVETNHDYSTISTIATIDDADVALQLIAACLFRPTFPAAEFEKERNFTISRIRAAEDNSFQLAYKHFLKNVYEGSTYGSPVEGEPETLQRITRKMVVEHHALLYHPDRLTIVAMGDFDPEEFEKKIRRHFGRFRPAPQLRFQTMLSTPKAQYHSVALPRDVAQSFICYGFAACPVRHRDMAALRVAAAVLGEGMSSRMFVNLRDKQSLAYQVGASFSPQAETGHFLTYIGTRPEVADDLRQGALNGIRNELQELKDTLVPPEELLRAKNYIVGKYRIAHQTNAGCVRQLGRFDQLGLGAAFDIQFPVEIQRVDALDVRRVARKYFKGPTVVMVHPRKNGAGRR
jgi:zinc protease